MKTMGEINTNVLPAALACNNQSQYNCEVEIDGEHLITGASTGGDGELVADGRNKSDAFRLGGASESVVKKKTSNKNASVLSGRKARKAKLKQRFCYYVPRI